MSQICLQWLPKLYKQINKYKIQKVKINNVSEKAHLLVLSIENRHSLSRCPIGKNTR